jgi:hypothetical protein
MIRTFFGFHDLVAVIILKEYNEEVFSDQTKKCTKNETMLKKPIVRIVVREPQK